jgi:hypothetical protein
MVLLLAAIFYIGQSIAQDKIIFRQLRYEDDFGYLKSKDRNEYEQLKFIPLSDNSSSYMSLGSDLRLQYFYVKNEDWGDTPQDKNGYLLSRYLIHADVKASKKFRLFLQLQASLTGSRVNPGPVEENTLDVHQLFFDYLLSGTGKEGILIRVGRQEMLYGSQRLIAVREFPNSRMAFDGAVLRYYNGDISSDLFYTHPIANSPDIFDDAFLNKKAKLWGAYTTIKNARYFSNIDLYYLGLYKSNALFNNASGRELRHSFGARSWKNTGKWQYDLEGVLQFGAIDSQKIYAWTVSSNTSYSFSGVKYRPRLGLKTELISGDSRGGDGKLETFNPLYPRGAYFGLAGLIGPANLFDLHPYMELKLTEKVGLLFDYDIFWRMESRDGLYAPNLQLIYSGEGTSEHFIGSQLAATVDLQVNSFLYLKVEGIWFNAGPFLKESGSGNDVLLTAFTTQLKF